MKTVILILALALCVAAHSSGPRSENMAAAINSTDVDLPLEYQWFHFVGNASIVADKLDPAKYIPVDAPLCSHRNLPYRCNILALPMASNVNQPDLTTIIEERTRATPTE